MTKLDPIVAYAHRIQTLEHNIQRALEGMRIQNPDPGKDALPLDMALALLVDAYGTHNDVAQKQGLLVGNFRTMFEAYRVQTYKELDARNKIVDRAKAIAAGDDPNGSDETEKAWEQEVLRKAREERAAKQSTLKPV